MKSILLCYVFFNITFFGFAQSNTISGTVYDEDKNVLTDANVTIRNTRKGTITNEKGQFALDATPKDTLVISYVGFETKKVFVGDQKEITVTLNSDLRRMDPIVLIAQGATVCSCKMYCYFLFDEEETTEFKRIQSEERLTSLFPNPSANGLFQLKLDTTFDKLTIEVFNMNGQLIQTSTHTKLSKIPQIDLSTQPKGMYLIRAVVDGTVLETKKAMRL